MEQPVIAVENLARRYGKTDAVNGLSFRVMAGRCYALFGRNGAGKTTTIKCLLNLLRPHSGSVQVFGLDPARHEVEVKKRLTYVPDTVAFYPWMKVREVLEYLASFRPHWNRATEKELLARFGLDEGAKVTGLSKGQRTQLGLISAICPEPELLILDEPTSGLDPVVRREFIRTVIGAYQAAGPEPRTILVSTHLISEFEGLIDEFTIMEKGQNIMTLPADEARERFKRIRARFAAQPPPLTGLKIISTSQKGRELELLVNGESERVLERLQQHGPESLRTESLSLEEIFLVSVPGGGNEA